MVFRNLCPTAGTCTISPTLHVRIAAQRWAEGKCEGCGLATPLMEADVRERIDGRIIEAYLNDPDQPQVTRFTGRVAYADWEGHGLFASDRAEMDDDEPGDWLRFYLFIDNLTGRREWVLADIEHGEVMDIGETNHEEFCFTFIDSRLLCPGSSKPVGAGSQCIGCGQSFGHPHPANCVVGMPAPRHKMIKES